MTSDDDTSDDDQPNFRIACLNERSEEVVTLVYDVPRYAPLTRDQLTALVDRIRQRFPMETDFTSGAPPDSARQDERADGDTTPDIFVPVTDDEIVEYRRIAYPNWLVGCTNHLRHLHDELWRRDGPKCRFRISIEGNMPGINVTISAASYGGVSLSEHEDYLASEELPMPPPAPRGQWVTAAMRASEHGRTEMSDDGNVDPAADEARAEKFRHVFFPLSDDELSSGQHFAWRCQEWRVDAKPVLFTYALWPKARVPVAEQIDWETQREIDLFGHASKPSGKTDPAAYHAKDRNTASGVLECNVEALDRFGIEHTFSGRFLVEITTTTRHDIFPLAEALVTRLVSRS